MYMPNSENDTRRRVLVKSYEGEAKEEITAEYNLPDYLPDVNRLLKVSAKIADHGSYLSGDHAEYDGKIRFSVLYATSDGSLKEAEFESEYAGNMPLSELLPDSEFYMEATVGSISCRLQNPRKLIAKAKAALTVTVIAPISTTPIISGRLSADEESAMQYQNTTVQSSLFFTADEIGTAISEDLELEASMPSIAEIVCVELDPMITDIKTTEKSLIYKGDITATILYLAKTENESEDTPQAPLYMTYVGKIPIASEIPTEHANERCVPIADVKIESLEYRTQENTFGEPRTFELDFEYSVMTKLYVNEENEITTDMYSTDYESFCEAETLTFDTVLCARNFNFSTRGTLPRDDKDFDKIVLTNATASVESMEKQGNKFLFTGNSEVSVILTNSAGVYLSRNFTVPFRAETDAARIASKYRILPHATVIATSGRMDDTSILCDLEILISFVLFETHEESYVRACNVYKDRPVARNANASLTLYYPTATDSLWDIAKKYSTTVPELLSLNNMSEEVRAAVLMIPKRRAAQGKKLL